MQVIVDGAVVHHAPDLKGYKIDTTRPAMRLNADPNAAAPKPGRYDSNQVTKRPENRLIPAEVSKQAGEEAENAVRFETRPQVWLEVDEERMQKIKQIWGAHYEYFAWSGSRLDRVEPVFNTLTLDKQDQYRKEFLIRDHAYLRETNPDAFRACLSQNKVINEIESGYSETLGHFTMDDWFDSMGEDWELWMDGGFDILNTSVEESRAAHRYVREQAELRGLLG